MRDLSLMTWKEIKEVEKKDSVVFVVMAPIEEHGWCLPLATDIIWSVHFSMKTTFEVVYEILDSIRNRFDGVYHEEDWR